MFRRMTKNNLTKGLLSELIIGNFNEEMNSEILNTKEVNALMDHQWEHPDEVAVVSTPDFQKIFNQIRTSSVTEKDQLKDLSGELIQLNTKYSLLRKRFIRTISIAASILLLIGLGITYYINTNQVFKKTYTENIAPKGQISSVILPDGTKAFLNSGSVLRYDNLFGRKYRNVQLVGEAYFEVAHNERLPFVINTDVIRIKVLGTKFNVMAYPEDNVVETIVKEGKVSVSELNGASSLLLLANEKATFNKKTRELILGRANPDLVTSWKENLLTFDNENFANVIQKLERWYNVKISVEGTDSIKDRFTLTVRTESLREVLELIGLTTDIEYTIDGNHVTIKYK
jgi:transmembrane sensor